MTNAAYRWLLVSLVYSGLPGNAFRAHLRNQEADDQRSLAAPGRRCRGRLIANSALKRQRRSAGTPQRSAGASERTRVNSCSAIIACLMTGRNAPTASASRCST
jgi:hypothetical protein